MRLTVITVIKTDSLIRAETLENRTQVRSALSRACSLVNCAKLTVRFSGNVSFDSRYIDNVNVEDGE